MIQVFEKEHSCVVYCNNKTYDLSLLKNKENIVLFSGGIDSQSVILYLKKHNIEYKTLFCNYSYNSYDRWFARTIGYDIEINVDLNLFFFDEQKHIHYYDLYKCTSPQLAVHLHIIDYIREHYPNANILMPGMPPFYNFNDDNTIGNSLPDYVQLSYYRYKEKNNLFNFFPYFWLEFYDVSKMINSKVQLDFQITDYNKKIQLYNEIGLNVSPQECKKTGFEEFKKYLKKEKQIIFNDTLRVPVNNNKPTIGVFDHSMISFELKNILEKTNV